MPTRIKFNLREAQAKNRTPIMLITSHQRKRLKWATGLSIEPGKWEVKTNRPRPGQYPQIRNQLNDLELIAENVLKDAGFLSQSDFTLAMNKATGRAQTDKPAGLGMFAKVMMEEKNEKPFSTIVTLICSFILGETLEDWRQIPWEQVEKKDIAFERIDWNTRQKFIRYCFDTRGLSIAYTESGLSRIGQMMKEARKRGLHTNLVSQERGWGVASTKVGAKTTAVPVSLTLEELQALARLELEGKELLSRDLFLIGVMTGQRHSDYANITESQVKNGEVFFRNKKTKGITRIALDMWEGLLPETLGQVLARHENKSPWLGKCRTHSQDVLTENIRALCLRIGMREKVEVISTSGGVFKSEQVEKWTVIGTHTARRTFATIWYKLGLPLADIQSATGHASEDQLIKYIGVTVEEKAQKRRAAVDAVKANFLNQKIG